MGTVTRGLCPNYCDRLTTSRAISQKLKLVDIVDRTNSFGLTAIYFSRLIATARVFPILIESKMAFD